MENLLECLEKKRLASVYDPSRFFKVAEKEYAAHDRFAGIKNPELRILAKQYFKAITQEELAGLLGSEFNEYRALALMMMVLLYQKGTRDDQVRIVHLFQKYIDRVNNWNLVDLCAHYIIGSALYQAILPMNYLDQLIVSQNMWHRRIAIVSMWYFIRQKSLELPISVFKRLLQDKHDLIGKALGWMLREMGKRDEQALIDFLKEHHMVMARVSVSYAVERFDLELKKQFIKVRK